MRMSTGPNRRRWLWPAAGALVLIAAAVIAWFVLIKPRQAGANLSLSFLRYSHWDLYIPNGEMAFLLLTNASATPYLLHMTGNKDTHIVDNVLGRWKESWEVDCEFHDTALMGRTNTIQTPPRDTARNLNVTVWPHSAVTIRVPVPPTGQKRRVAALCDAVPGPPSIPAWASKPGLISMLYWRLQLLRLTLSPNPEPVRVWCEREIIRPETTKVER